MKTHGHLVPQSLKLALAAILALGAPATAQAPRFASWQLQWENDAFAAFSGSDEHYTNGIRFSFLFNPQRVDTPGRVERFGRSWCIRTPLCGRDAEGNKLGPQPVNWGFGIGQSIYTPERLEIVELIETDRPYAGYLYGSMQLFVRTDTDATPGSQENRPTQNYFELQVGIVGPEAGAESAQTEIHELIDDELPMGWDNQLPTEPTVQLLYQWRRKIGNHRLDVIPNLGTALGTVAVYANAGATARFGLNLSDFPVFNLAPTAVPPNLKFEDWEAYLFIGGEGRAIAHNIFLDGTLFSDSHSVDKESFVYDLKAGFLLRYKKWQLSYTFTRRGDEFSPNFDDDGRHDYGSVAFTYLSAWPGRSR